ncbi:MAG: sodium:phosphate symporter [Pelagibacterium sp. SCN 63-23]|nr:MAG: sodium:phosphate symporter [Pelagibacterium sp. SCN 63-23]
MSSTIVLIDLIGAVALLLWGLRLLKGGVNRAFGTRLRTFMAVSTRNRMTAFGAGLAVTLALQSSTAMAIMVSSFAGQGLMSLAMAQAVMLGANVGTSLVTQVLAFDIHWLAPASILAGMVAAGFRNSQRSRGASEILIGLGLMLLSLKLMREATDPMRESEAVLAFFGLLSDAPVVALALSAALAAISASSLAVVLFVMALAGTGNIDAGLCLLMVAGANLGGAIPPLFAVAEEGNAARQVAFANLLVRGLGSLLLLVSLGWVEGLAGFYTDLARLAVDAHVAFNLALAVLFLPFVGTIARLVARIMPRQASDSENAPRHLDDNALADPPAALAAATRETLRIGDTVEKMLEGAFSAVRNNDEPAARGIYPLDDKVDTLQEAVKLYLSRLDRGQLDAGQKSQAHAIIDYAVNLEHVGDIIERSLVRLARKKIDNHLQFSEDGLDEIEELFLDTIDNLQLAQTVFLSRDEHMARRLMEGKVTIRHKERQSSERHLARLREGRPETLQTTGLHLDVLRDLKRINAHLASVTYPILDEAGALRESRLRKA